jgi:hypothetical protein
VDSTKEKGKKAIGRSVPLICVRMGYIRISLLARKLQPQGRSKW